MSAPALVAIGASRGGLSAMLSILRALPPTLGCAIAVVLHRDRRSDGGGLCEVLQQATTMPVSEAEDKQLIEAGHIHVAPADYHLLIDGDNFALSVDPPVHHSRPSIDVFFESVAAGYGTRAVAGLLTGSGHDGVRGLGAIQRAGGRVLVQDPTSAHDPAMPLAALDHLSPDAVMTLAQLAHHITDLCASHRKTAG